MPKKSAAAKESASAVRSERRARKQADREAQRRKRVKDQIGTSVRYTGVKGTATITLPSSSSYATTAHACRRIDDEAMLYFGMLLPELCDEIIQCARLISYEMALWWMKGCGHAWNRTLRSALFRSSQNFRGSWECTSRSILYF